MSSQRKPASWETFTAPKQVSAGLIVAKIYLFVL